jgi:outer membrane biosynthesis protein TonB
MGGFMQVGRAFGAPLKDPKWLGKIVIGVLILFVPVLNIAVTGWGIQYVRDSATGSENILPSWSDLGRHWVRGIAFAFATVLFYAPAILIVMLFGIPGALTSGLSNDGLQGLETALGSLTVGILLALVFVVAVSILVDAAKTNYAMHGDFGAAFNFKEILARVQSYPGGYFTAWAMGIVAVWGAYIIGYALAIGVNAIPCLGQILSVIMIPVASGIGLLLGMGVNSLLGQYAAKAYAAGPSSAAPAAWGGASVTVAAAAARTGVTPALEPVAAPAPAADRTTANTEAGLTGQAAVAALFAQTRTIPPGTGLPSDNVEGDVAPALDLQQTDNVLAQAEPPREPESILEPAPEPTPEPEHITEPEPIPEPERDQQPAPTPEPESAPAPEPSPEPPRTPATVAQDPPTPESRSAYELTRIGGPGRAGERWTLPPKDVRIGRDDSCFIAIPDGKASRVHAALRVVPEGLVVEDMGSSNGTTLNGSRLEGRSAPLRSGDEISIGDTRFAISVVPR